MSKSKKVPMDKAAATRIKKATVKAGKPEDPFANRAEKAAVKNIAKKRKK